MRCLLALTAVALAAAALPADAQSLRVKRAQSEAETAYAETLSSTNEACGTEITASFDWDTFPADDFTRNVSIPGYCEHPLTVMRAFCTADDGGLGKEAVSSQIASVTCARGEERMIEMTEGAIRYTVNFDSSNDYYFVQDWLLDNL